MSTISKDSKKFIQIYRKGLKQGRTLELRLLPITRIGQFLKQVIVNKESNYKNVKLRIKERGKAY
ncbi:hypothetical protein [Priestia filamentosa]|uniref:hypothetical protein n=1 Tax=Priestia filamentosa TaxID=1402861 RepID=UPI000369DF05|nr:hypothetical protein [Priestia filamentosa]